MNDRGSGINSQFIDIMAQAASIEELLKAGAHFGHLTRRWNPKMKEFIFMQRNGIHIIDLKKNPCSPAGKRSMPFEKVARSGKKNSFSSEPKKNRLRKLSKTRPPVAECPTLPTAGWVVLLTNFSTVRKSIARMEEINKMRTDGTYENITKKERLMLDREYEKLEKVMGGISNMSRLPGAIFVVDIVKEDIAINEAMKLNIPIFAMVDTNCDPDIPDYIIPANDDAAKAIHLITSNVADAVIEGAAAREEYEEEQAVMEAMEKKSAEESGESDEEGGDSSPRRRRRKGAAGGAARTPRKAD